MPPKEDKDKKDGDSTSMTRTPVGLDPKDLGQWARVKEFNGEKLNAAVESLEVQDI